MSSSFFVALIFMVNNSKILEKRGDCVKLFFRRLKEANLKKITTYVKACRLESKIPSLLIFIDMCLCSVIYGVGFYDYYIFGFVHIHGYSKRKTFFTMKDNWCLNQLVNNEEYAKYFRNKALFYEAFNESLGREWLDLEKIDQETFHSFVEKNPVFFTKQVVNFGGLGVKRIDTTEMDSAQKEGLMQSLINDHFGVIEQPLIQHPQMNAMNPSSINTIRIATLIDDNGEVHVMFHFLRTGIAGSYVDNSTSGGLNVLIGSDGVIHKPALRDKTGVLYKEHPDTKTSFIGFEIPYFKEAIELCKKSAYVIKDVRYVGWDVCITPTGPVFVEGNYLPAYDGQLYHQVEHPGYGLKPLYKKYVKDL